MKIFVRKPELALLAVAGVSVAAVAALLAGEAAAVREIQRQIASEQGAFGATERVLALWLDTDRSQREYLFTSNFFYLQPYGRPVHEIEKAIKLFVFAATAVGTNTKQIQSFRSIALQKIEQLQATLEAVPRLPSHRSRMITPACDNGLMRQARNQCTELERAYFVAASYESAGIEHRSAQAVIALSFGACGIILGLLLAAVRLNGSFAHRELLMRQMAARQVQYEALVRRLQSVREEERSHLARELHDELGQRITALKFDLAALDHSVRTGDFGKAHDRIRGVAAALDDVLRQVRAVAMSLRPALLDEMGLSAALQLHAKDFEKRTGILLQTSVPEREPHLNEIQQITVFRIAQEALTNIARHAGARAAYIELACGKHEITLTISDNGRGFNPQQQPISLGVLGMRERAAIIGAEFNIQTPPAGGTVVQLRLPLLRCIHDNDNEPHSAH